MHLVSVNVGQVRRIEIDGRSVTTAIVKRAVTGSVRVRPPGLEGDEQADPSVHGGLAKALYAYPVEHYPFWRTVRAQAGAAAWDAPLAYGGLGENLTVSGLTEDRAYIGDRLRFANCTLAVSEPRHPCFKFNAAMGFAQAGQMMAQSTWCGFYLAVIEAGTIEAGEAFVLHAGPREVRIDELFRATTSRRLV
ncbi:MAG: MOSC domain-containing protein [Aquincola sp.]|nr:MOSC domain-containing protein [Aquincola sp.]MDH4289719.1 MOSC domain-containing protein [Aquincola sp.]